MRQEKINIEVGTSIQLQFQRNQLKLENIFKEFIDNSLQSFRTKENNIKLKELGIDKCVVLITISKDEISISDNAYGMNLEAFKRALTLNEKNKEYPENSLGEFGMGLKYAAISLGYEYTIETTMLGNSEKYTATINEELLKKNSKIVIAQIDDTVLPNEHYSKITIRNLIVKITNKEKILLMEALSKIYHIYLGNEELEINFYPNQSVKYEPPQLWINEDGSEFLQDFEGELTFGGKRYEYFGWIGILHTADTSKNGKAGFSLLKQDRIIVSNYRPELLLGKANSFPYQRIVGEINLNEWPVDFNKGSFTWNNGLQDKFIIELKNNSIISKFIKIASSLRKSKKNRLSAEKQQIMVKKDYKRFESLKQIKKTVLVDKQNDGDLPVNSVLEEDMHKLEISYEGQDYQFLLSYCDENERDEEWINVSIISIEKNQYSVRINNNLKLFKKLKQGESELMQTFAIIIAISELSSITAGFKDSYKFVKKINEIIKNLE